MKQTRHPVHYPADKPDPADPGTEESGESGPSSGLRHGFTLAELLIALAILGVIATFTIPKVLQNSTSSQNASIAKEAASMVSGAFSAYQLDNAIAATNTPAVLTQFLNYVRVDTTSTMGASTAPAGDSPLQSCAGSALRCLQLHNGAILQYATDNQFGSTLPTHGIVFNVDPDGSKAGAGRISFVLYTKGRLTTGANAGAPASATFGTTLGTITVRSANDPSYLQNWN